jgi:hypothetical protein
MRKSGRLETSGLDAIQNHSAEKLSITNGNTGELNSHTTGGNRVIWSKAVYPDHFRIDYQTTI